MRSQTESFRLAILTRRLALFLSLVALVSGLSCKGKSEVARLRIPMGIEVLILVDDYYENDRIYSYQVIARGEAKVPTTYMCNGGDPTKVRFEAVVGKQGAVVGVIENHKPNEVLMLYDPSSGESWPHASSTETFEDQKRKGLKLLEKLQPEKPAAVLKLSDSQQCKG